MKDKLKEKLKKQLDDEEDEEVKPKEVKEKPEDSPIAILHDDAIFRNELLVRLDRLIEAINK